MKSGNKYKYESGDHVAIWPINPTEEVSRILKLFDLEDKQHKPIKLKFKLNKTINKKNF